MKPNCLTSLSSSAVHKVLGFAGGSLADRLLRFLGIAVFAALAACQPYLPPEPPPEASPWPLGPGDHLRVVIFEQNQLGGEFAVGDDGTISLPLVGRLQVAGSTPAATEKLIADRFNHGILKEPQVNVEMLRYRPIYVYGEVTKPGAYDFAGKLIVLNAVSLAGGYTYRAQKEGTTVIRNTDPDRKPISVRETTPVGPGDVIYVPERWF